MKLAAVMLVRDEADIIEQTIRHLVKEGVERVVVADNRSTDNTPQILQRLRDERKLPLWVVQDPEIGYFQSAKTTRLAMELLDSGYSWVIPCDADEWWYSAYGTLREIVARHDREGYDVIPAQLWDHIPTGLDDPADPNPFTRIGWRFGYPGRLPKVACRLRPDLTIGMGKDSAKYEKQFRRREGPALTLRHFTWRTEDQYVLKIRNGWEAYAHTDLEPTVGGHWRMFGPPDEASWEERVRAHYQTWFYVEDPLDGRPDLQLIYDPATK